LTPPPPPPQYRAAQGAAAVTDSTRLEYAKRVNRAIDHVREHLGEALTLADLARVAAFSPFHFHRVFRAITGETLSAYVQRQRIEKAAAVLASRWDPSVLAVALDHGFASAATFARAFRAHFGMSATQWRRGGAERWRARRPALRKAGKHPRKPGKASGHAPAHTRLVTVHVQRLPVQHVAYMRYGGPYGARGIPELWSRLRRWMATRDLDLAATVRLGVAYDDAGITESAKCSYDACVVVPPGFAADRWVNLMDVPGGQFALAPFRGSALDIEGAWERVFAAWLPASGFQPDDRPCVEIYRGAPLEDAKTGIFRCDLALPVRPL
jgi:AraC family transcriptional regulator